MNLRILAAFPLCLAAISLASAAPSQHHNRSPHDTLKIADGFKFEALYSPPKSDGSWVSMCVDSKGRLIVSDQYEGGLFRVTPPQIGASPDSTRVEKITVDLSGAQGLLWQFNSLYVLVSKNGRHESGLYRVRDSNNDDQLDTVELLRSLQGGGDHGWHALLSGPDQRSIYVVAGNATKLPPLESSAVPFNWSEDHLLPRLPDGRGFMTGVLAPGGCIYEVNADGTKWRLVSVGFRNPYDAAFNRHGDLFTFDADMEWDLNTPWYRPTRICLVTSGSEFGWRNGSGKWPDYYADSLPSVADIGPGSPTGITFGYGAKFPARYQNALFIADWSYGRIYTVHLKPNGAAYTGETELFMSGAPLPTTDLLVNPSDGALYIVTGGWRIQTTLYRVTYQGPDSIVSAPDSAPDLLSLRRKLEQWHGRSDPKALPALWPHLGHPDRFIRYAARIALESQDPQYWRDRALTESNPATAITALIALVRVSARDQFHRTEPPSDPHLQSRVLNTLDCIQWNNLSKSQQIELLRLYSLLFTRLGTPDHKARRKLADKFDALFPATQRSLNAELCQLLVYLQSPNVAAQAMALVHNAPTQEEQLEYIKALRMLTAGWTPQLRNDYFAWFNKASGYRGGASFAGFVQTIKNQAVALLTPDEKIALKDLLEATPPPASAPSIDLLSGRSFVREWSVAELSPRIDRALKSADPKQGRALFGAAGCFACHRFSNEGGALGPDLTGAGGRFSTRDLLEAVIEPSKTLTDLYAPVIITKSDGDLISGRIVYLGGDNLQISPDMLNPSHTITVPRSEVENITLSQVSPMPEGLLNVLTESEIADLTAFILSGLPTTH